MLVCHIPLTTLAPGAKKEDKKSKAGNSTSGTALSSPTPVNQLDDVSRETFATGRPMEDTPDLHQCKHCKKSILKTVAKQHIAQCLRLKKEKAQRKKEAREARERAKEQQREEEARKADEENGVAKDEDSATAMMTLIRNPGPRGARRPKRRPARS